MLRILAVGFLALALAGCAESPAAQPSAAPAVTVGRISGVVVDPGIVPVEGALVELTGQGLQLNTTTGDNGIYRFDDLPFGTYFLKVSIDGYLHSQTTVELGPQAGEPPVTRIILEPDPLYRAPFIQPFKHRGLVQCGIVLSAPPLVGYAAVAVCEQANQVAGSDVTPDSSQTLHALDAGAPAFVQSEMTWSSSQMLSNQLLLYLDARERGSTVFVELGSTAGPSPVLVPLLEGRTGKLGKGADLQLRVFPWYESPAPVGATFEQEFEVISHVFYGFAPPEGWQFSVDGLPEIPPA
ncbi:MAG: carboxypeptidase-like regulatory domain-containing protein [Candidatus Thermoplasmatota archaeon]